MKKKLKSLSSLSKMDNFNPLNQEQLSSLTGGSSDVLTPSDGEGGSAKKSDFPVHSGKILNEGQATAYCIKSC